MRSTDLYLAFKSTNSKPHKCKLNLVKMSSLHAESDLQGRRRGVVPGGAGGTMAPPDFGRSVNPILTGKQIMPT